MAIRSRRHRMRRYLLLAAPVAVLLLTLGYALIEADRTPVVRHATVALPDWPRGAAPVRVAFASDLHLGNWSGRRARMARVIAAIGSLQPDLIVLGGDYVAGNGRHQAEAVAADLTDAVRHLRAPLGVVAVLGNHDHDADAGLVRAALTAGGATVLVNEATRRGPLAIGGVDDMVTDHDDEPRTVARMKALSGAKLMVSHAPNAIYTLPPTIRLVLAGHTHCGQIVLPLIGAPWELSEPRYRCGVVRSNIGQRTIVSAGTGTSVAPLRLNAPPDIWLLTLRPEQQRSS